MVHRRALSLHLFNPIPSDPPWTIIAAIQYQSDDDHHHAREDDGGRKLQLNLIPIKTLLSSSSSLPLSLSLKS